jgi:pimeloyl-ACP methyl ester carboxylesterase
MNAIFDQISSLSVSPIFSHVKLETGPQSLTFEDAELAFDFEPSLEETEILLVLVNGYQRSRLDFRAFRKRLRQTSNKIATLSLDNRGSGETKNSLPNIDVFRMARDVALLAALFSQKLNLQSYSALGISMGGMICQALGHQNKSLENLILVSTTSGGSGRCWPNSISAPENIRFEKWPSDKETLAIRMRKYFGERFLKHSPLLFDLMVSTMLKAFEKADPNEKSQLQFNASAFFDGTTLLKEVSARTLVVTGSEDKIIPKENSYYLNSHLSNSKLIEYAEIGHLILMEEPEKFVADVASFLHSKVTHEGDSQ